MQGQEFKGKQCHRCGGSGECETELYEGLTRCPNCQPDPDSVTINKSSLLCECGGQVVYFGEALMGSLRCNKCDQWLMGVGEEFIETIDSRWMRGDRGYIQD